MRLVSSLLSLALCWAVFTSSANATVILSFGNPETFVSGSGIRSINVFANSTLGAGESAISIGADFVLGGGAVFNAPNAGTFGGAGFLGAGNIQPASSFGRDPAQAFFNTGYLNMIFVSNQNVPSAQTPLATLLVNTNGLAVGNYSITSTNGFFGLGNIADTSSSFNITAVPEPTSIALLGVGIGGFLTRRVLRRRKAARA